MSIVIYSYPARCKHCEWCGYIHPLKKDGTPSRNREYYYGRGVLSADAQRVTPHDSACDKFSPNHTGTIIQLEYVTGKWPRR